ncbi:MAG: hypothetical protein RLZZ175_1236 [Bacteroidota bacterium]|jgi:CRP-like cAMP-binding protein
MQQLIEVIRQMICVSDAEVQHFTQMLTLKNVKKNEVLSLPDTISNEIFFIKKGIVRVKIIDKEGTEHTIHFAMENQFIADYSSFIQKVPSFYTLQTLEDTELLVLPRAAVEWGFQNMLEGQKLGRLIAEYYYIYQDQRIKNTYALTPKQRYDSISQVFPNIHNRAPQHMIASYLGITPVHLSRLKKQD